MLHGKKFYIKFWNILFDFIQLIRDEIPHFTIINGYEIL